MSVNLKTYSYFILLTLFLTSCLKQNNDKVEILINNWEFREQGQQWFPAIVPGSIHLDLYNNLMMTLSIEQMKINYSGLKIKLGV